jgi:hypothetical protein
MLAFEKLTLAAVAVVAVSSTAYGADPRCNKPPYGGSPDRYRAFVQAYSQKVDDLAKMLEEICNMKFGGADRTELHKIGITNDAIDTRDTSVLAVEMLQAAKIIPSSK